ncbi:hypothetical protein [Chitinimonas lacunae]|uniref:Uncharacterized protein n=1 Tax=Chitinimonas lacunae TaxID=1963018 RepID=A0ABV8MTX3_9NEIS
MSSYRILLATLPIVLVAGHRYLVLLDPAGDVLAELNGLATSRSGRIKPIGYLPSDRLKVYESGRRFYRLDHPQTLLCSGELPDLLPRWQAAREAMGRLNAADLPYPLLGFGRNSNSVVRTLLAVMDLPPQHRDYRLTPGARSLLLAQREIEEIQQQHGLRCGG